MFLPAAGESGDMSEVKGATGQAPQWAPAKGLLEYVRMPGHAPGQIVLLHKPTASLLAADTITNLRGGFLHKTAPQLGFAPPGSVPSWIMHAGVPLEGSATCPAPPHVSMSERTEGPVVLLKPSSLVCLAAHEGPQAPHACCHPDGMPIFACAACAAPLSTPERMQCSVTLCETCAAAAAAGGEPLLQ